MICHIIDYTKVYSEHTLYLGTNCPRFRIETFSKLWMQRFVAWILCTDPHLPGAPYQLVESGAVQEAAALLPIFSDLGEDGEELGEEGG